MMHVHVAAFFNPPTRFQLSSGRISCGAFFLLGWFAVIVVVFFAVISGYLDKASNTGVSCVHSHSNLSVRF